MTYWDYIVMPVLRGNALAGYLLQIRDVTSSKKAEIDRARLLAQWEALFETIPDPIFVVEAPGRLVAANRAALKLMGVGSLEELGGSDLPQLFPLLPMTRPDGSPLADDERPAFRALRGERFTNYLCRMGNIRGEEFYLSYSGGQVSPVEGMPARSFIIGRDVTELEMLRQQLADAKMKLEQALQESESRGAEWAAIFDGLSEAIFVADDNQKIVMVNKAGVRLGGHGPDDVLGKRIAEIHSKAGPGWVDGKPVDIIEDSIRRASSGTPFENLNCKFVNLAGAEVEVLASGGKIETPRGTRFYFVARDVTEIRRLERTRQEFMQVVSHELRNPIQVIRGLGNLIKLKLPEAGREAVSKHFEMLDNQVESVSRLLDDIVIAYRAGAGALAFQFRPVNLLDVLAESVTSYVLQGTHEISVDRGDLSEVTVYGDPDRLAEIIGNLLSNATKYSPTGKRVWVRVGLADGDSVLLTVEDEGIGIPPDQLERVFDGFYRAGNVSSGTSRGIGLGLHISREFARRHGGDLWAENRPEGGTRVCLKLPLHRTDV
jgi:PAS domain S-box-containing protein